MKAEHPGRFSATILVALLVTSSGCVVPATLPHSGLDEPADGPELAGLMGDMQRFSAKLGYAVEAGNRQLSTFYLEEIQEALDDVALIETHDGLPIAQPAITIMPTLLSQMSELVAREDWDASAQSYAMLIDGCNRCHAATEHEFVEILPARGESPFNQAF